MYTHRRGREELVMDEWQNDRNVLSFDRFVREKVRELMRPAVIKSTVLNIKCQLRKYVIFL